MIKAILEIIAAIAMMGVAVLLKTIVVSSLRRDRGDKRSFWEIYWDEAWYIGAFILAFIIIFGISVL